MTGRGFFVLCHLFLHTIKQIFGNNGRDTIRDNDLSVAVLTNVSSVVQHVLDTVIGHFLSAGILDAFFIEPVANLRHSRTFVISLERFKDKGRSQRIDLEILLAVNDISKGKSAAVVFASLQSRKIRRSTTLTCRSRPGTCGISRSCSNTTALPCSLTA